MLDWRGSGEDFTIQLRGNMDMPGDGGQIADQAKLRGTSITVVCPRLLCPWAASGWFSLIDKVPHEISVIVQMSWDRRA